MRTTMDVAVYNESFITNCSALIMLPLIIRFITSVAYCRLPGRPGSTWKEILGYIQFCMAHGSWLLFFYLITWRLPWT